MGFERMEDFQEHLDSLGLFHMDLGLDRVRRFLEAWGGNRPPFAVAHVLGTNGKGSTATFLASLAKAHGLRTGLYTSPHFLDVRERALLDGGLPGHGPWLAAANRVMALAGGAGLTYFELLTCLALELFRAEGVDLAVMEAGLGGRFDAVSALATDLTLFTPVGLDHEKVLGPRLGDIAADKAAALKPGGRAVSGPQVPLAREALSIRAAETGAPLEWSGDLWAWRGNDLIPDPGLGLHPVTGVRLGLRGPHQRENARLALAAWTLLARMRGWPVDPGACRQGLARAFIPGRMQFVPGSPPLILDGAHNAHALAALKAALEAGVDGDAGAGDAFPGAAVGSGPAPAAVRPSAVIFACFRDKDLDSMLPLLLSLGDGPVLVPELPHGERAWPAADLAGRIGPRARAVSGVEEALKGVQDLPGPVLVCGSLYLLAEFYTRRPGLLTAP